MTACAIYCRVSTEKQKEKHTIESQKRILPAMAEKHHWSIHRQYIDDGISGEALRFMPALRQLLADAEADLFSHILIIDIDRFTRFARDSERALIVDICLEHHIQVVTPDQIYDLTDRNHRLQFAIKGTVSLYEKDTIRERCKRGIKEKRLQGRWLGGIPPAGYRYNRNTRTLEINPATVDDIRQIMTLATDHSPRDIARQVPAYTPRTIRRILEPDRLTFYTGRIQLDGQIVDGQHPAIITTARRTDILAAKKTRNARGDKSTQARHLLTGLGILRCGYCGRSLKGWTDKKIRKNGHTYIRTYYRCTSIADITGPCKQSKMIPAKILEAKITTNIETTLGKPDILSRAFTAATANLPDIEKTKEKIKQKIIEKQTKKKRLIHAIEEDVLSFTEAKYRIETINNGLAADAKQLDALKNQTPTWNTALIDQLAGLSFQSTPFHESRKLITTCIKKILVNNNNAYIEYRFPVMESGATTKRLRF